MLDKQLVTFIFLGRKLNNKVARIKFWGKLKSQHYGRHMHLKKISVNVLLLRVWPYKESQLAFKVKHPGMCSIPTPSHLPPLSNNWVGQKVIEFWTKIGILMAIKELCSLHTHTLKVMKEKKYLCACVTHTLR